MVGLVLARKEYSGVVDTPAKDHTVAGVTGGGENCTALLYITLLYLLLSGHCRAVMEVTSC